MSSRKNKWKIPDFSSSVPDFQAERDELLTRLNNPDNFKMPDFQKYMQVKMDSFQKQIENPDYEKINAIIEKLGGGNDKTANTITKVANAIGIDVDTEKIKELLDKKDALQQSLEEKAINKVAGFMAKQGHPLPSTDELLTGVTRKMKLGEDPIGIMKDVAQPFTSLAQEVLDGKKINASDISVSGVKNKIIEYGKEKIDNAKTMESIESVITQKTKQISDFTERTEEKVTAGAQNPNELYNVDNEAIKNKIALFEPHMKFNTEIPPTIQKIIDKIQDITGGNI